MTQWNFRWPPARAVFTGKGGTAYWAVPLALGYLALASPTVRADFVPEMNVSEPPQSQKFYIDKNSLHNSGTQFNGYVGAQGSPAPLVAVTASGPVTLGNGYATIKPNGGTLTSLIFTPEDPNGFGDFTFRGQLTTTGNEATGSVMVKVQDNQGHAAETFTFSGLKFNADFGRLGIEGFPSPETILYVEIMTSGDESFKEVKQISFSPAGTPGPAPGVPEPASAVLLGLGLALTGAYRARTGRKERRPA